MSKQYLLTEPSHLQSKKSKNATQNVLHKAYQRNLNLDEAKSSFLKGGANLNLKGRVPQINIEFKLQQQSAIDKQILLQQQQIQSKILNSDKIDFKRFLHK